MGTNLAYAANVLVSGFLIEAKIIIKARANVITVQPVSKFVKAQEVLFKGTCDGGLCPDQGICSGKEQSHCAYLATCAQTSQPDSNPLLPQEIRPLISVDRSLVKAMKTAAGTRHNSSLTWVKRDIAGHLPGLFSPRGWCCLKFSQLSALTPGGREKKKEARSRKHRDLFHVNPKPLYIYTGSVTWTLTQTGMNPKSPHTSIQSSS